MWAIWAIWAIWAMRVIWAWAPLRPKIQKTLNKLCLSFIVLDRNVGRHLGPVLGLSWACLNLFGVCLDLSEASLGLGDVWAQMEPSRACLGEPQDPGGARKSKEGARKSQEGWLLGGFWASLGRCLGGSWGLWAPRGGCWVLCVLWREPRLLPKLPSLKVDGNPKMLLAISWTVYCWGQF